MSVDVISKGAQTNLAETLNIGFPSRVALIRFPFGPQIVLGNNTGNLLSLGLEGTPKGNTTLGTAEVRGLDDAKIAGQTYVAAATNNGVVSVLDETGQQIFTNNQETLRRMRAFDLNADGKSEIITGGEYGAFFIYSAADGSTLFNKSLWQASSDEREVELNGDTSSREIVVGGKDGGGWAFSFDGTTATQFWTRSLADKVTEISGL